MKSIREKEEEFLCSMNTERSDCSKPVSSDIAIIGGGISGLSLAFWLIHEHKFSGKDIVIYEQSPNVGGWIQTFRSPSGQLYERGPRSLRISGERGIPACNMITSLALENEVVSPLSAAQRRYILINGKPEELPSSLISVCTCPLGRKIVQASLLEPLYSLFRKKPTGHESVSEYVQRIFSNDAIIQKLADSFTAGIWAANSTCVSSDIVFPYLKKIETQYGSVVVGALFEAIKKTLKKISQQLNQSSSGDTPFSSLQGILSFREGLKKLPQTLALWLHEKGVRIITKSVIRGCNRQESFWEICHNRAGPNGDIGTFHKKLVIAHDHLALPPDFHDRLKNEVFYDPFYSTKAYFPFQNSVRSSVVSIAMGWKKDLLRLRRRKILPAFGLLASSEEDPQALGIVLDSCLFQEHTSSMLTRMTVMVGGTRFPEAINMCDESLVQIARDRLSRWLDIEEPPCEYFVFMAPQAIAVPKVSETQLPPYVCSLNTGASLYMASSAIGGVAIPDCISSTQKLAKAIAEC